MQASILPLLVIASSQRLRGNPSSGDGLGAFGQLRFRFARNGERGCESPGWLTRVLPLAALVLAAPALADDLPADLAESRLRGCLLAGASGTGQTQLEAAVIQVRAYCGAQIRRVQDQRVKAAAQGLSGNQAEAAKTRAIRALNTEIAQAVANFSGLQP
jgi:hypothetical protein